MARELLHETYGKYEEIIWHSICTEIKKEGGSK
jgi:hypothetical protein